MLWGLFLVFLTNIFNIFQPKLVRECIDLVIDNLNMITLLQGGITTEKIFQSSIKSILLLFGITIIFIAIARGIFMFFMRQTLIVMSRHIEFDLKNDIYKKYQNLSVEFYKTNETGDLMNRITEDVSRVRMYAGPCIMYATNMLVTVITVVWAMFQVNVELTFYTLIPLPLLAISIYFLNSLIHKKSDAIQQQLSTVTSLAQETYSGIRVVKSFVRQNWVNDKFADECDQYHKKNIALAKINSFFGPLMLCLVGASTVIVILVGGTKVIAGEISGGTIAEFIIYLNLLIWPISSIGWVASMLQRAAVSQSRINEFLNSTAVIPNAGTSRQALKGAIRFDNVSLTYPHSGIAALSNINLHIEAGENVLIVGKTGSGKSTLLQLLMRMYDAQTGAIFLDGIQANRYDLHHLRNQIGYVPQEIFLFSDTVENNLLFGVDKNFDKNKIKTYTKLAAIHQEIERLENGYQTIIGERGVTLSGGQKQRIALARALIKNPNVLLMDDSLSAIDANTEVVIQKELNEYFKNKTSILVSHRLFAHITFDKIIMMENGTIIEVGSHEQLMQNKKSYYALFMLQRNTELN